MKHSKTDDTLILVGGALLGAAALYLLDPNSGQRRRRRIARAARDAYEATRHAVGEHWDDLAGHTKDLTQRISGETTGWHKNAADSAHASADQAREITHHSHTRSRFRSHRGDARHERLTTGVAVNPASLPCGCRTGASRCASAAAWSSLTAARSAGSRSRSSASASSLIRTAACLGPSPTGVSVSPWPG